MFLHLPSLRPVRLFLSLATAGIILSACAADSRNALLVPVIGGSQQEEAAENRAKEEQDNIALANDTVASGEGIAAQNSPRDIEEPEPAAPAIVEDAPVADAEDAAPGFGDWARSMEDALARLEADNDPVNQGLTAPDDGRLVLTPPPKTESIVAVKVAILLPLSGKAEAVGKSLLRAAQLALFEVGGDRIELLPRDTKGTSEGARLAANDAIASGAELILGPLFRDSVPAVKQAALASGVNVVAFTNDRRMAGQNVHVLGFTPEEQVMEVVRYAVAEGRRRFAVLAPDTAYGNKIAAAVNVAARRYGAQVVRQRLYPANVPALSDEMARAIKDIAIFEARRSRLKDVIRDLKKRAETSKLAAKRLESMGKLVTFGDVDYEALILPEGGARLQEVAALLPHYDIDTNKVKLIGTGLWNVEGIGREPALQDGWFAGPQPGANKRFLRNYQRAFGDTPPFIASLAYDAVALSALLASDLGVDRFSSDALRDPAGFYGVEGIFRFNDDAVVQRGLAILALTGDGGFAVKRAAPASFQ